MSNEKKLLFVFTILQISIIATLSHIIAQVEDLPTDDPTVQFLVAQGIRKISQIYEGEHELIFTNIVNAQLQFIDHELNYNIVIEMADSECAKGSYSTSCAVLEGGKKFICSVHTLFDLLDDVNMRCYENAHSIKSV